jgi:ERCC4-type nuclease
MIATLPSLPVPNLKTDEKFLPTIITDSREQTPLVFSFPTITAGLTTGDYSVAGLEDDFCIERKSLNDLYASLTSGRDRFKRELHRMKAFPFCRLLIIGSEHEIEQGASRHRGINPKSILHSLHAIEARGVPVVFANSSHSAAILVERWAFWRVREVLKLSTALSSANTPKQNKSFNAK